MKPMLKQFNPFIEVLNSLILNKMMLSSQIVVNSKY